MKKKSIAKAMKPLGPQRRGSIPIDDIHEDIDTLKKDETSVTLDFDDHSRTKRTSSRKLFALTKKEGRSDAIKRPSSSMKTPPSSQDGEEKIHTRKSLHDTCSQPDLKLPPSSIVEAQEYGEKNRFQDQVAWALQCVAEQGNTRYQALATLLSLFGNKRSRNVPHATVLNLEVVPLLSDLDVMEDSLVAIAVATLLFISSQAPDQKQSFLSSEKTMVLIESLLQASAVPQEGRANPLGLAVNRIFRDIDFARLIPRETHFSPVDICLATLCSALAPNACPPATLEVKVALRQAGVLRHIVRIVLSESAALTEQRPTMATVQSIWRLHRSLSVLEFCCFACPENENFFSKLEVSQGCEPYVTSMKLSNWLLLQIHNLSNQALIEGMKKDCLGSLLAVLMNITQNNEDVLTVVPISGLKVLTAFLSNICLGGRMCPQGVVHNIEVLYTWVDELNACLGVLINLVASNSGIREELRLARVSANGTERSLVFLLSRLIVKVRSAFGGQAGHPGQKDVQNEDSQEVTLDILREGEGEATAATVESYAAILLGLLVKDSASARLEAQQIFSDISMEPVIDAIQRCLVFYLRAGALTFQMENTLKDLVVALRNQLINRTEVLQATRINCKAIDKDGEIVLWEGKSARWHIPPKNEFLLFNEQNSHVLPLLKPNKSPLIKYSRMATGRSFRQRPLDAHKELPIVRDESLLDSTEGLPMKELLEHDHKSDSKAESKGSNKEPQKAKFIPIPGVIPVSTYDLEYLPVFKERNTYIRGRGGIGYDDPTLVEYDIDTDDELWLKNFNKDQEKLTASKFEAMLWKLDVANAEATDKSLAFQTPAERLTPEVCGTTEFLTKENALAILSETCPARDTIAASVYDYWLEKRNLLKQPLLRRLQAPTPLNNQDPFRVFRLRDKIHRPQTRRRRENNVDSYDKLQMISTNIKIALDLFENVVKRERKKRDMTYVVTDWQQLQIKQKFNPKSDQDVIEQEYLTAAKLKNVRRPVGFEKLPEAAPGATNALLEFRNKKNKRRKRLGLEAQLNAIAQLPPPVLEPEPQILFSNEVPPAAYNTLLTTSGARTSKLRVGRGGRFVMDRCRPFTWEIAVEDQDVQSPQVYEMSNPYSQWAGRNDLAEAALSRLEIASGKLHVACVKSEENDLKAIDNASAEN